MLTFYCFADLQHDILSKCRNNNYVVDSAYVSLKGQLVDYALPKHPWGDGDEKEGTASEQGADQSALQVAPLGAILMEVLIKQRLWIPVLMEVLINLMIK